MKKLPAAHLLGRAALALLLGSPLLFGLVVAVDEGTGSQKEPQDCLLLLFLGHRQVQSAVLHQDGKAHRALSVFLEAG